MSFWFQFLTFAFQKVRLNRKPLKLPHVEIEKGIFSVAYDRQNNVLLRIGKDLKIVWDGNSYAEVTLSKKYKNRVCGLCGNYNNDTKDDLENADGSGISSVYSFGQSWRIGSWKSCKSARDRQYHEKMEREKKRQRQKQRQLGSGVRLEENQGYGMPAFLSIRGDRGRSLSRFGESDDRFLLLDRARIITSGNNGRIDDFLKSLPLKSPSGTPNTNDLAEMEDDWGVEETPNTETTHHHRQHNPRRHRLRKICAGGSAKWRTRRESIEHCRLLKSPLFARCHSVVSVKRYFR